MSDYRWYAFDGTDGNDVCVRRVFGAYVWYINDRKYPDPPGPPLLRRFDSPLEAVAHARKRMAGYQPPFSDAG